MTQNQSESRGSGDLTRPRITPGEMERAIAEGRRLQGLAMRRAFGRLLRGIRKLVRRGLFPVRIRHRLGGRAAAGC